MIKILYQVMSHEKFQDSILKNELEIWKLIFHIEDFRIKKNIIEKHTLNIKIFYTLL